MEALAIADFEPPSDALVARACRGDFDAFAELYRRHVGRVFALCLRLTGESAQAEELTQESFVRAWQRLSSYRGPGGFEGWLRRLAVNVALTEWRARRRRARREESTEERFAGEPPDPVVRRAPAVDLERAIAALPAGARRVFVLHDVEGYRHDEIAELLEVSIGTSKSQLHRARRLLREALER